MGLHRCVLIKAHDREPQSQTLTPLRPLPPRASGPLSEKWERIMPTTCTSAYPIVTPRTADLHGPSVMSNLQPLKEGAEFQLAALNMIPAESLFIFSADFLCSLPEAWGGVDTHDEPFNNVEASSIVGRGLPEEPTGLEALLSCILIVKILAMKSCTVKHCN